MIRLNNKMYEIISKKICKGIKLNSKLQKIIDEGFIERDGCFFFANQVQEHLMLSDFVTKTDFEAFVNSIHIDDYVSSQHLEQSIKFINNVKRKWRFQNLNKSELAFSLAKTDFGFNIKFYVNRNGETYMPINEIESFLEAQIIEA